MNSTALRTLLLTALLSWTSYATAYAQASSDRYTRALEDSLIRYEYLKPLARQCDAALSEARDQATAQAALLSLTRIAHRLQIESDSVHYAKRTRLAERRARWQGRKQGAFFTLAVVITALLTL